ncbi:MAG: hypothetical protein J6X70_09895 [Muribaculaceae bacterium]|nr:hypothetical protein [Muribaculaceae bacterium]
MSNFEKWDNEFRAQNLYAFNNNTNALLWLKVRAVCRGKLIGQFLNENGLALTTSKVSEQNIELFELLENRDDAKLMLDRFLQGKNHEWYTSMGVDEEKLKADLYKVQYYAWGGDHNNSLDKHLVSRYVKVISEYDNLVSKQGEIANNAWNYVQNSWYNNWTSYLIESLFKRHPRVISAVGEIKSVDFFIDDFPIDLKVTFFPNQYMDEKIKAKLGKSVLSWLKAQGKKFGITANGDYSESQQIYTLTEKLSELGHYEIIKSLNATKREVIRDTQNDPIELMVWLYAHQGEMRFGAENRLFVVLADSIDMNQSWKMKRAFSLIEPKIQNYLDCFTNKSLKKIDFNFKKQNYTSLADVIFVISKTEFEEEDDKE